MPPAVAGYYPVLAVLLLCLSDCFEYLVEILGLLMSVWFYPKHACDLTLIMLDSFIFYTPPQISIEINLKP